DYAYKNAFEPQIDFSPTLTWFIEKSSQEALEVVNTKNLNHRIPVLDAVRQAVSSALGDYNEPYVAETPPQLFITKKESPDLPLNLKQLSDGYRTMLALVMDLARRMALAYDGVQLTAGESVLHTAGIVLIDEIELHLHPSWQQTVLPRLREIFPNVQFIVTTNSPQVVTSIDEAHVRILGDGGRIHTAPQGTWGAEASRVMKQIFGVDNRPPSQARDDLEEYSDLVYADKWNTDRARQLRLILDERYGRQEPELVELDLHIENRKWEMNEEGVNA
ncbi:MAG: AAA family ATPase, partial [Desulfovibrio sp.]|nr:AAA family ATPase [Desulfovibrio sp.]